MRWETTTSTSGNKDITRGFAGAASSLMATAFDAEVRSRRMPSQFRRLTRLVRQRLAWTRRALDLRK